MKIIPRSIRPLFGVELAILDALFWVNANLSGVRKLYSKAVMVATCSGLAFGGLIGCLKNEELVEKVNSQTSILCIPSHESS